MFQPAGGMGRIGEAFARQIPNAIRYGAKVTGIHQDERGVTVTFEDLGGGAVQQARADWCVCALPLTILSQLPVNVSAAMKAAIDAVPYASVVKTGLQFKRRFWEEDEHIFGGISYTDLPIRQIAYPSAGMNAGGKGVLLGGYTWDGPNAYELTAMSPAERIEVALDCGAQIHPQYRPSSRPASRSPGIACRSRSDARANGRTRRAATTMTISARSTAGSCWRASTPPICRPGRRARSFRRSTRSRACTADPCDLMGPIRMRRLSRQSIRRASAVCARRAVSPRPPRPQGLSSMSQGWVFEEQGGEALYAHVCAGCHQPDAKGAVGAASYPALAEDKNLASAEYVETLLFNGRKAMPPLGRMMSDQQAADVINYVRTHFGNAYRDAVSAADVEAARRQAGSAP